MTAGQWTAYGWYTLNAGQCSVLDNRRFENRFFYIYAYIPSGEGEGNGREPLFNNRQVRFVSMCIDPDDAFTLRNSENCEARGYETQDFAEIDTGGFPRYLLNLYED